MLGSSLALLPQRLGIVISSFISEVLEPDFVDHVHVDLTFHPSADRQDLGFANLDSPCEVCLIDSSSNSILDHETLTLSTSPLEISIG